MKIRYSLTYLNEDGTEFENHHSFNNQIELNDYIAIQEKKFNKSPLKVKIIK